MQLQPLPETSCRYGAPMGRHGDNPDPDFPGTVYLEPILDPCPNGDPDYDYEGAYWGLGPMVWRGQYEQNGGNVFYFRAHQQFDGEEAPAIAAAREIMPSASRFEIVEPLGGEPCEWCLECEREKTL